MESAQWLSDTWANLHTHDIWVKWDGEDVIEGCLKEQGCVDSSPAVSFLDEILAGFPDGYKRRITIAAVDVNTGDFILFDQDNTEFSELHQAAFASGSIPFVFPNQRIKEWSLMDGGTDNDVNIMSAVE